MGIRFPKRPSTRSYLISAILHLGLLSLAFCLSQPEWAMVTPSAAAVETAISHRSMPDHEEPMAHMDASHRKNAVQPSSPSTERQTIEGPPSADDPELAEFVRRRIEYAQRQAEEKSPGEQRADLEELGHRLNAVASEESVVELSDTLSHWLGADERPSVPTAQSEGEAMPFDPSTAQISDVKQIEGETGVTYVAILVDAAGSSMESELDAADGAQLYETFQLIKRFPLMEMVYRRTVMGLLDKLARETPAKSPALPTAESDSNSE